MVINYMSIMVINVSQIRIKITYYNINTHVYRMCNSTYLLHIV